METVIYVKLSSGVEFEVHCNESDVDKIFALLPNDAEATAFSEA